MDIYIAICCDHHADEDVKVFTKPEGAIKYAKDFILEGYYTIEEEKLSEEMKQFGWIYLAGFGTEADRVRVEKGQLDPITE